MDFTMRECVNCRTATKAGPSLIDLQPIACGQNSTMQIANSSRVPLLLPVDGHAQSVDCSFKGGAPGFVRVIGDNVVAWPDYDGNRMYRSLGNIVRNARVGLLFFVWTARFTTTRLDFASMVAPNR